MALAELETKRRVFGKTDRRHDRTGQILPPSSVTRRTLAAARTAGSGIRPEDYRAVIRRGVRKVNYYTYMAKAGAAAISNREYQQFHDALTDAEQAMKENVKTAISIFSGTYN